MRILFAGTPALAIPSLEALVEAGHEVAAVLTRAPAPVGRKRILTPSPVEEWARSHGLEVVTPASLRGEEIQRFVKDCAPEAVAVVAYGFLVPPALLDIPRYGWINLHFSLLPAWRGAAPVQYAIAEGDSVTGACTFRLEEGLDTGPIFARLTQEISPVDTSSSLVERLSYSGAQLLTRTFAELPGATPEPQVGEPSFAPTLTSADAQVNWEAPAQEIDRRIRAYTPAPGAWTTREGKRYKLGPVRLAEDVTDVAPGQIRGTFVGTGTHAVELRRIAPAGKKEMDALAWARGAHLDADAHFSWKEQ